MTLEDISLLLAVIGATGLVTSWIGRRTGDAPRDVRLMGSIGACLLATAGAVCIL